MLHLWWTIFPILSFIQTSRTQQTFFPSSIPLAVKSPYLNAWYSSADGGRLSDTWPSFAIGGRQILGWTGMIRVDGMPYQWMGNRLASGAETSANVTSFQITPTRSIFVMQAGPMNVTVTFLTPIEPSDWVRQSMPFSYVSIEANSLDGNAHDVQVYSDVSGEWLSGDLLASMRWSTQTTENSVFHEATLQNPKPNSEVKDEAADGTLYYAMASRNGLSWQVDTGINCRVKFKTEGRLTNTASQAFNAPLSQPWIVFAISADLGSIQSTAQPVAWAIGLVRNPSIPYSLPSGNSQSRVPYFISQYDARKSVDAFATDFSNALQSAIKLDEKILGDASKVSKEYADLVSISTRQVFASLDITLGDGGSGGLNMSDVKIFMKDMGRSRRVNPVEVMYAAFPALLYFNASLGGALLSPLLEAQESSKYHTYAAPDLGTTYPVADGRPDAHTSGIEHSASMLIMAYAHAMASGDVTLLQQHYSLLKRWADYLVANTLTPNNQTSMDTQPKANMTNLAVKGIIDVKAMAMINYVLHNDPDGRDYDDRASSLTEAWLSLAVSDDGHLLGQYGQQNSWSLLYNLYYDKLLGLNITSHSVLANQTAFYSELFHSGAGAFGLPIDDDSAQQGDAAWNLFTAATMTDSGVRDQFIRSAWARATSNQLGGANPTLYNVLTGTSAGGEAGAAQGAMYALLALDVLKPAASPPGARGPSSDENGHPGSILHSALVGTIVGGALGLAVLLAIGGFLIRRRRRAMPNEYRSEFGHPTWRDPEIAPGRAGVASGIYAQDGAAAPPSLPPTYESRHSEARPMSQANPTPREKRRAERGALRVMNSSTPLVSSRASTVVSGSVGAPADMSRGWTSVRPGGGGMETLPRYSEVEGMDLW